MRILIIRPLEDALPMIVDLKSKGIQTSHHPLFKPHYLPVPPLFNPAGLVITSKNAIRALKDAEDLKKFSLYAVGDQTATLAQQHGFLNVMSASGTSHELIKLVIKNAQPGQGTLWYLSGAQVKGNALESLRAAGLDVQRQIVYRIEDAPHLPVALCQELEARTLSHVLFYSPRTTSVFIRLLREAKLEKTIEHMTALCFSEAIREVAAELAWNAVISQEEI